MNIKSSVFVELIFISIAVLVYFISGNIFFIFNFTYIGTAIAVGLFLMGNDYKYARNFVMLAVGSYILFYLGIFSHENMLLSGFWYYLFLGVFQAAVIHFLVAKICGPFIFGRGWCGYACWTAMILDLLPFKSPENPRKNYGFVRYILFIAIFSIVTILFVFKIANLNLIMYYLFIAGNIIYYALGITLAYVLKDNRAFCKYICPIAVFLKLTSYFSLLRVTVNKDKCVDCGNCRKVCVMNVGMLDNSRKRVNATECILCGECVKNCSFDALKF